MKIGDMLLFIPRKMRALVGKNKRFDLDEKLKDEMVGQGLYHFAPNEEVADIIMQTEYLKPAKARGLYGKTCASMYCGRPDVDNYYKNINLFNTEMNPYVNPTMVAYAIKFTPRRDDLKNYTIRAQWDNAVLFGGHCILPHQQIQKVQMVPDFARESDGTPIKDQNGNYIVEFREATPKDKISPDGKSYEAPEEYLEYMRQKASEIGYRQYDSKGTNLRNIFVHIVDRERAGEAVRKNTVASNRISGFTPTRVRGKKVAPTTVEEALNEFGLHSKNPYYDPIFSEYVAQNQTQPEALTQLDLNDVLNQFTTSSTGEYFYKKYNDLTGVIIKKGIHGKQHSERVGLMAMMIAEKEGVFAEDSDNRIRDILATAAMYHDLGRVLDAGPHAKNSVRKLRGMTLRYSNGKPYTKADRKLLYALVDAHEGLSDKIYDMIPLYDIRDSKDKELAIRLSSIVRDADALDRVRTDFNFGFYKTDLKPKYLVNRTSKQFLNLSYQLEFVTKHIRDMRPILGYQTDYEKRIGTRKGPWPEDSLRRYEMSEALVGSIQGWNPQKQVLRGRDEKKGIQELIH